MRGRIRGCGSTREALQRTDRLNAPRSVGVCLQDRQGLQLPEGRVIGLGEVHLVLRLRLQTRRGKLNEVEEPERIDGDRRLRLRESGSSRLQADPGALPCLSIAVSSSPRRARC